MIEKKNLLIVEDDPDNQKLLSMLLRNSYHVDVCDNAKSFYETLNQETFDIILMDISLNGNKDGLQLSRELKANPKFKTIPIVVLTAHAFQKDKDDAYNAGIDLFLTKPILKKHLLEALDTVVNRKPA